LVNVPVLSAGTAPGRKKTSVAIVVGATPGRFQKAAVYVSK
jgi:hypothetical protein